MNKKEYSTLNNLIQGNNSFYNVIKTENRISSNIYIEIELIILYFKLNINHLPNLDANDYALICELLESNYTIEGNNIVIKDQVFDLKYFIELIYKIESYKKQTESSKIIKLDFSPQKESKRKEKKTQIIDLKKYQRVVYFTMKEREYIFEKNAEINDDTLPFVLKTNSYFKELINYMILNILGKSAHLFEEGYIDLLFFYLSLYPFVDYSQNKASIPFEKLDLPQNEIGLRKTTYDDEYLRSLELESEELENKKATLRYQKSNLQQYSSNYNAKVGRIDAHISAIEEKQLDNYYTHYAYRHSSEIYNQNLFKYLMMSFEQGNVFINESFQNPVIKFFYIQEEKVEFYCAMHLNTLLRLYDSEKLLPEFSEDKKLEVSI